MYRGLYKVHVHTINCFTEAHQHPWLSASTRVTKHTQMLRGDVIGLDLQFLVAKVKGGSSRVLETVWKMMSSKSMIYFGVTSGSY